LKRKLFPLSAAISPGTGEATGFYILNHEKSVPFHKYEKLVPFHKYSSLTEAIQK